MSSGKQSLLLCIIFPFYSPSCYSGIGSDIGKNMGAPAADKISQAILLLTSKLETQGTSLANVIKEVAASGATFGSNLGLNTLIESKATFVALGAFAGGAAKATLALALAHPCVSITVATGTVLYGGYRFYRRDTLERAILALKESEKTLKDSEIALKISERIIAEKAAEAAREMLAREMHIKEEDAKMARELHEKKALAKLAIMMRNAHIKNGLLISVAVTAAGVGLCFVGYKYFQHRKRRKQDQDLCIAKQGLLIAIARNEHNEIGLFKLPEGCAEAAGSLLALPGGKLAFDEIISTVQYPYVAIANM